MLRTLLKTVVVSVICLFVATVCVVCVLAWNGMRTSLHAERTLHAYYLVLDLVGTYVDEHDGQWPGSWEELEQVRPPRSHGGWQWPNDRDEIARRVRVDFGLSSQQVAAMTPASFSGVEQSFPNYGTNESRIGELIERVRTALNSTQANGH